METLLRGVSKCTDFPPPFCLLFFPCRQSNWPVLDCGCSSCFSEIWATNAITKMVFCTVGDGCSSTIKCLSGMPIDARHPSKYLSKSLTKSVWEEIDEKISRWEQIEELISNLSYTTGKLTVNYRKTKALNPKNPLRSNVQVRGHKTYQYSPFGNLFGPLPWPRSQYWHEPVTHSAVVFLSEIKSRLICHAWK